MSNERLQQKLALEGGLKAVTTIEGKGKPKIGKEEFMAVVQRFALPEEALARVDAALSDEDFAGGPYLANYYTNLKESSNQTFARMGRKVFDVKYALPMSSGTAALHAAFVAAGVGPGKEVILSAIGFYATAAAVVMAKGVPVFCDVDESLHMDPKKIEALITKRTACIAPTHVMGSVANMDAIMKVANKHKIPVVEDCAQSNGGKVKGKYVGTWGDLGIYSISAYKIVGGGEGGMLVTNDEKLYDAACCLSEGGGLTRPVRFAPERYPGELFVGTNYRMSELEAAIDAVQLRKMPALFKRFHNVKMRILGQLKTFKEITPQKLNDPDGEVGYTLRFFPESIELGRKIVAALNAEGVGCGMRGDSDTPDWHIYHYMFPLVLQKGGPGSDCPFGCERYQKAGGKVDYKKGQCPVADDLFQRMISISLNQWYSAADCKHIATAINKVLGAYCTPDAKAKKWL
ncbi:MAG: aminotransferase class V-fold PLP-dependent enzyme [Armatimonadia bacterium]